MFAAIAAFELRKRRRMLSSWIYWLVLFAAAHLAMAAAGGAFSSISVGGGNEKVHANAPGMIGGLIAVFTNLGILITASVFGQAVHQDRETGIDGLLFTTPITKASYLGGRYLGSVLFALGIFTSLALGLWSATWMPYVDKSTMGANSALAYVWPYVISVLPNVLFSGAIFFALSVITRRMMPVYIGAVLFVIVYLTAGSLLSKLEYKPLAAMLDPFGQVALRLTTEYWTVAEQNTRIVPLSGLYLANRALWLALGAVGLVLAFGRFRFDHGGTTERRGALEKGDPTPVGPIPTVRPSPDDGHFALYARMTKLALVDTVRDVYFLVILIAGVAFTVVASFTAGSIYGTTTYPVTVSVLEINGGTFALFVLILTTFYAGELVWRERDARVSSIMDALPLPTWIPFASKLTTLVLVQVLLLAVLFVTGIGIQTAKGYYHYELGLYAQYLGLRFYDYLLLSVLALTVQVIVNHKYVGHFVMVLYYLWGLFSPKLGLEHHLYEYSGTPPSPYSDMNRWGHFLRGVFWFDLYWAFFALLLAIACGLLWPRGTEYGARLRLKEALRRATLGVRFAIAAALLAFIGTGAFIYYNTNILSAYKTSKDSEAEQADYEKAYKRVDSLAQPRITAVALEIDIFPEAPSLHARGTFTLVNQTKEPVPTVYVNTSENMRYETLTIGGTKATKVDKRLGMNVFELPKPIAPGETIELALDTWAETKGFKNDGPRRDVVENGTFWNSFNLPILGYFEQGELTEDKTRAKYGLPAKDRLPDLDDPKGRTRNYVSHDADWIDFKATVSTSLDQIAIAPGYLQREWTEGSRRYFAYAMDQKILNFYSVLSARYEVRRDKYDDVALEIYYHAPHTFDLDQMMAGMKDSLAYFERSFGPYQHRQARILEFPRYAMFAQSFPNTIPYSEAIGFIAKVDPSDPKDIDFPYYITAHEIAHQWWAHQVISGEVQGQTMLSETLAQYSALMVMKRKFGEAKMKRFLSYELDRYLRARPFERKREMPLLRVENQLHIHYQKGSLVMYALADYLGEETVNRALANVIRDWKFKGPPYPTSRDLLDALRAVTPPELAYLLHDMIETITLYDNRATAATAKKLPDGKYEITVTVSTKKLVADELGSEQEAPVDDLIDLGALDAQGTVIFREKRRLKSGESTQVFVTDVLPEKAGIDPMNVLIDRKPDDNVVRVTAPRS